MTRWRIIRRNCELIVSRRRHTCVCSATACGIRDRRVGFFFNIIIILWCRKYARKYYWNKLAKSDDQPMFIQNNIIFCKIYENNKQETLIFFIDINTGKLAKTFTDDNIIIIITYLNIKNSPERTLVWIIHVRHGRFLISDRVISRLTFLIILLYYRRYGSTSKRDCRV